MATAWVRGIGAAILLVAAGGVAVADDGHGGWPFSPGAVVGEPR